jgi:hypothetical protein
MGELTKMPELAAALFSLLPDELLRDDLSQVFEYFGNHVNRSTGTFWTLWLRDKPLYRTGFPVQLSGKLPPFKEHLAALAAEFMAMLFRCKERDCEQTLVYINCWTLLCLSPDFIAPALLIVLDNLNLGNQNLMRPVAIDYLHPILVSVSQTEFEGLRQAVTTSRCHELPILT